MARVFLSFPLLSGETLSSDPVFQEKAEVFSGKAPLILISNKMLYLKSRVFHTLVPHVPCVTPSHKNLTRLAL